MSARIEEAIAIEVAIAEAADAGTMSAVAVAPVADAATNGIENVEAKRTLEALVVEERREKINEETTMTSTMTSERPTNSERNWDCHLCDHETSFCFLIFIGARARMCPCITYSIHCARITVLAIF